MINAPCRQVYPWVDCRECSLIVLRCLKPMDELICDCMSSLHSRQNYREQKKPVLSYSTA